MAAPADMPERPANWDGPVKGAEFLAMLDLADAMADNILYGKVLDCDAAVINSILINANRYRWPVERLRYELAQAGIPEAAPR